MEKACKIHATNTITIQRAGAGHFRHASRTFTNRRTCHFACIKREAFLQACQDTSAYNEVPPGAERAPPRVPPHVPGHGQRSGRRCWRMLEGPYRQVRTQSSQERM